MAATPNSTQLYELTLLGLLPSSLNAHLIDHLSSLSTFSTPFSSTETVLRPLAPLEGSKLDDGLLRVKVVKEEGEEPSSYLVACSRPESERQALVTPVMYTLLVGGADPVAFARGLGYQGASSFTKRGLAFSLPSLLRVEVYKIERDGKEEAAAGWLVEVRSPPVPSGAVAVALENALEIQRSLVGLVRLARVDP